MWKLRSAVVQIKVVGAHALHLNFVKLLAPWHMVVEYAHQMKRAYINLVRLAQFWHQKL